MNKKLQHTNLQGLNLQRLNLQRLNLQRLKKSALTLSVLAALGFGFSAQATAEAQSKIGQRLATTNSESSVELLDKHNQELNQELTSEQKFNELKTSQYSTSKGDNLKAEISLDFEKYQPKTREQMLKQAKSQAIAEKSSKAKEAQEKGLDHLYIYDSAVYLQSDRDGDGYYSRLRVDFDVDASYDDYFDVYAQLFIREIGSGSSWTHYYTTDVFTIHSNDGSDDYSVTTNLNTGFPPANYEVLIDLYEYGYSGVVDTLDQYDDPDLGYLPLEDATYDSVGGVITDTQIQTVKTEIFTDNDNDGFYRDFKITFDVDTEINSARDVFVKLYQRSGSGGWQFETETAVFTVDGTSADDAVAIDGDWQAGYATDYYDFRLEVIDANTNEVLDDVSNEFDPLLQVPLEDANKDQNSTTPPPPPPSTDSSGSGGGSWSILGLSLLAFFGFGRQFRKSRK